MRNLCSKKFRVKRNWAILTLVICATFGISACAAEDGIQRNHFLLLDSRVVEKTENAKLFVGMVQKHEANPLFVEDKPWEMRFDNLYGNVMYDEQDKIYKCWYSPFIIDQSANGMSLESRNSKEYDPPDNREMGICYATSIDGITWEKPELGLVRYGHSNANNILWRGSGDNGEHWEGPHGAGIFKDLREQDPDRLYKMIFKGEILSVAFSRDGIHWGSPIECREADVAGDTHNNSFWAPTLGKYVGITRSWGEKKGRQVVRTESEDFIHWTKAEVVLEGISKNQQTYAMPVFYHGGIYLGLVAIHDQKADRVWTELTWSPDTKIWNRVCPGTPLIPLSDKILDYDYGCVYPCAYPVFLEDEIRLYYGGSDYLHFAWRSGSLCLATLRPDGFAGYEQEDRNKPGVITTSAIPYGSQTIHITADVAENGSLKVQLLDKNNTHLTSDKVLTRSVTDGRLDFPEPITSDEIRFRFELSNAKIYSFKFVN